MSATNGDNPRLDRIEKILEAVVNVQQDMRQEHQMLLRAQIVQGDLVTKLGEKIEKMIEEHKALSKETDERFRETDERFRDTDERLAALIKIMDEWIRRPGERI